jgi:hypothetical protein
MVGEAINAAREGMEHLGQKVDHLQERMERRERLYKIGIVVMIAMVAAIIWLGVGVRANAAALRADQVDDAKTERDRVAKCVVARLELRDLANAIADGSADGIHELVLLNPRNQTPEFQPFVDQVIKNYREEYRADLISAAPDPDDC